MIHLNKIIPSQYAMGSVNKLNVVIHLTIAQTQTHAKQTCKHRIAIKHPLYLLVLLEERKVIEKYFKSN